ncbi:MAG: MsnO8 family LLM class oxidoreductase [Propionibacterium sp.]|nr:MsnO8 family LLM class oxidoreductase [Propionibacterium sp.]
MRYSILDRAIAVAGLSESEVLRSVVDHARSAEERGFERFLVAEHHGVPGIPGSQPTVLASAIAASTSRIRVGTGGIMLPSYQPLIVAEQIGVLEALFPGRIDAGIGSSIGFTRPVRTALRQDDVEAVKSRFTDDLEELLSYLSGDAAITARPQNHLRTPVWLLANFRSLLIAAKYGLGVIVGGPSLVDRSKPIHDGLKMYREQFRPSAFWQEPTAIAAINVAVADDASSARDLLLPQVWAEVKSRSTGAFDHLLPVADLDETTLTSQERARVADGLDLAIHGTPEQVRGQLRDLQQFTGVDEVLVTGDMGDYEGRARSEQLLVEL